MFSLFFKRLISNISTCKKPTYPKDTYVIPFPSFGFHRIKPVTFLWLDSSGESATSRGVFQTSDASVSSFFAILTIFTSGLIQNQLSALVIFICFLGQEEKNISNRYRHQKGVWQKLVFIYAHRKIRVYGRKLKLTYGKIH